MQKRKVNGLELDTVLMPKIDFSGRLIEHVSLTHTSFKLGIPRRGSTEGVQREYRVGKEWVRSG
jgi:hypothetical protein